MPCFVVGSRSARYRNRNDRAWRETFPGKTSTPDHLRPVNIDELQGAAPLFVGQVRSRHHGGFRLTMLTISRL